ncbi:MAG: hypothetical protein H6734_23175 [Alphaproteobacteria bacterium]|nr:hypothetical protein [Alphaproteobacteria bacterium]
MLLCFLAAALAGEPTDATPEPATVEARADRPYPKAIATRTAGQVLTVTGSVVALPSTFLVVAGLASPCGGGQGCLGNAIAVVFGTAGMIVSCRPCCHRRQTHPSRPRPPHPNP